MIDQHSIKNVWYVGMEKEKGENKYITLCHFRITHSIGQVSCVLSVSLTESTQLLHPPQLWYMIPQESPTVSVDAKGVLAPLHREELVCCMSGTCTNMCGVCWPGLKWEFPVRELLYACVVLYSSKTTGCGSVTFTLSDPNTL